MIGGTEDVAPMGRAFVTGATGGIGSTLCEHLSSRGCRVVALARPGSQTAHIEHLQGLDVVRCDLFDTAGIAEAMQGAGVVFHLAAMVHASPEVSYSDFQRTNIDGTRSVLDAAVSAGVKAFVLFSTVAVYPESDALLDESSQVGPSSAYGRSKLGAEAVVLEKRDVIRVTILRLPVVYGLRDRGNVRRLIAAVAARRFVVPGSGHNVKTMVASANVADAAIMVASDHRAAGKIYIVTVAY